MTSRALRPLGIDRAGPMVIDLALRLTLFDLLLRPIGNEVLRPLIVGTAVIGLLRLSLLRHPLLWLFLATLTGTRVLLDWPLADNHAYLLSYWCLAVSLALMIPDANKVLAVNARLLIGLVFLFACIWKIVESDHFVDGTFFQVILLADSRFEGFARMAGGLSDESYRALNSFVLQHADALSAAGQIDTPPIPVQFKMLALAATWWNLFINAALAIVFLWPTRRGLPKLSHALLLVYCVVTYAIATVDGFGWLLLAMGATLCDLDQKRTRYSYVVVFVLIIFYREVPWAGMLMPLFRT